MRRIDLNASGGCRAVACDEVVYFTGHVALGKNISEQTRALCKRYDELFLQNGLKKENILYIFACVEDASLYQEFEQELRCWLGDMKVPEVIYEGRCTQPAEGDKRFLELALWVAEGDSPAVNRTMLDTDIAGSVFHHTIYCGAKYGNDILQVITDYCHALKRADIADGNILLANIYCRTQEEGDGAKRLLRQILGFEPCVNVVYTKLPDDQAAFSVIAASENGEEEIKRLRDGEQTAVSLYQHTAYFSALEGKDAGTVFARFGDLFADAAIPRENVATMFAHLPDISLYGPAMESMLAWCVPGCPASGVAVEAIKGEFPITVQLIAEIGG